MLRVGVTGTRFKLNMFQKVNIAFLLQHLNISELHHGDCTGADAFFHLFAQLLNDNKKANIKLIIHPPTNPRYRAYCKGYSFKHKKQAYLKRNHNIVNASDLILAAPKTNVEYKRSGTWATVRYARKINKPLIIIPTDYLLYDMLREKFS